jgi:hypothetical protein
MEINIAAPADREPCVETGLPGKTESETPLPHPVQDHSEYADCSARA